MTLMTVAETEVVKTDEGCAEKESDARNRYEIIRPEYLDQMDSLRDESMPDESFFRQVIANGPERKLHQPQQSVLQALNDLLQTFPNFREVTMEIIGRYRISLMGGCPFTLPVINLQGPPGVGKTTYVRAVARALSEPFHDLKVSQMLERFELAGMSQGWKNARPGKIAKVLLAEESGSGQPVLFFDELCMAKDTEESSVIHPLYTLFDRDSGEYFRDLFLDAPINTSYILVFCATNNIERLRPALRSRLSSFSIEAPSGEDLAMIAQNLYRQLLERLNLGACFPKAMSPKVMEGLTQGSIRDMKKNLERAIIRRWGRTSTENVLN